MALYPTNEAEVQAIYESRRDRLAHPAGKLDHGGRWYPSEMETASCCSQVRSPSRAHPYSYMVHCRTRKHIATWLAEHPDYADQLAERESLRKQRANFNAVADGVAPPYPSEY